VDAPGTGDAEAADVELEFAVLAQFPSGQGFSKDSEQDRVITLRKNKI
jgi:hypothetical protein